MVVLVIFILFAVKLASYYPSCHCTQRFFVIFVKIVVFDVFAVKLASYHPSSDFALWLFCCFHQNRCFRHFHWGVWTLVCTMPWLHSAISFVIFFQIDEYFYHFHQPCWSLWTLSCLMPHAIVLSNFLKSFCQNCFFSIFFGVFGPSHASCHLTQQFFGIFVKIVIFVSFVDHLQ